MVNRKVTLSYWIMLAPALIWLVAVSIVPMGGIIMAFEDYNPRLGIMHSEWVGLENFDYMFSLSDTERILENTLIISFGKIIFHIIVPLTFALMLNEIKTKKLKKSLQTVAYLPHFISWVILSGILRDIFSRTGPINNMLSFFNIDPIIFWGQEKLFRGLIISTDVWKEFGFDAVIYLAALTGIDMNLYEAVAIDGGGKFKQLWHVTLPGIKPTVILMTVLSMGNILNAGFDQVFNLYSPLVYATGDIIDTWVYRVGITELQFSLATAVGLLKSVVGFVMLTVSYVVAYRFSDYRIF